MGTNTTGHFYECTLGEGVHFRSIRDERFKTQRISVNMMVPLDRQTAAANALLPAMLARANRAYPDYTRLGQRLSELYGASLTGSVHKQGDIQVLSLTAVGIADRYALEGEKISAELTGLLCASLFEPVLDENGLLPEEDFLQEQRQTLELLESELNDKMQYARRRATELLLEGEPAALSRCGTMEEVQQLTREDVTAAWREVLKKAVIEIMVLGDCSPEPVLETARQRLPQNRQPLSCRSEVYPASGTVRETTESMDVQQCKMILGFRSGLPAGEKTPALKLMSAVLGGTPHSKLFQNVREKLSLCYYCSAQYNIGKGILLIESGVEGKNLEKAREEILRQLEEIREGHITQEELDSAKMSVANGMRTVEDYLGSTENWYLTQTFRPQILTPEEFARQIEGVTAEEVQEAAKACVLDAVYVMKGLEE